MRYHRLSVLRVAFLLFSASITPLQAANIDIINYHHLDRFKAYISTPSLPGAYPGILFLHDPFLSRLQHLLPFRYDQYFQSLVRSLAKENYVLLMPIEPTHPLAGVKGAIEYLNTHPHVIPNHIHLIGMAESGLIVVLASQNRSDIQSVVAIHPHPMHAYGPISTDQIQNPHAYPPMLFLVGGSDHPRRVALTHQVISPLHAIAEIQTYPQIKRWFWNPENAFMSDIAEFIESNEFILQQME